jgi:hypothetical protein
MAQQDYISTFDVFWHFGCKIIVKSLLLKTGMERRSMLRRLVFGVILLFLLITFGVVTQSEVVPEKVGRSLPSTFPQETIQLDVLK